MGLETALIGVALSGVASLASIQMQSAAQQSASNYQAQVDERNAVLAEQDREQAVRTARIAADDKARQNRRQLASMRASFGSTGLELSGSPLEVLTDSSIEMALDTRRIKYEGQVRSREGALQVLGLKESANVARAEASNARTTGFVKAGSSLIDTGTAFAGTETGKNLLGT